MLSRRDLNLRWQDPQAAEIMQIGRKNHWPFKVHGRAPVEMVDRPVFTGDWWLMKAEEDRMPIPHSVLPMVMGRVQTIEMSGIHPRYVIAHETPKALASGQPKLPPAPPWWETELKKLTDNKQLLGTLGAVLAVLAPFLVPMAVLGAVDPILFAVTPSGHWVEIARWDVGDE